MVEQIATNSQRDLVFWYNQQRNPELIHRCVPLRPWWFLLQRDGKLRNNKSPSRKLILRGWIRKVFSSQRKDGKEPGWSQYQRVWGQSKPSSIPSLDTKVAKTTNQGLHQQHYCLFEIAWIDIKGPSKCSATGNLAIGDQVGHGNWAILDRRKKEWTCWCCFTFW